ncbi:MAG: hypothetical protein WAL72_30850 [Streptosporangiaceae bacterium]
MDEHAQREMGAGRPEPFKALWSHAGDVVIMGGFGGYERGWEQVSARLEWASKGLAATDRSEENIVTVVGEDLGYTVDLEHMTRHVGGQPCGRSCHRAASAVRTTWSCDGGHGHLPEVDVGCHPGHIPPPVQTAEAERRMTFGL